MPGRKRPENLVAEARALKTDMGRRLADVLTRGPVPERIDPGDYPSYSAEYLILADHHGRFLKPCPGTRGYNCCGLRIFHFGLGCNLGCSYCILQDYLDTEALVLFGNLDDGLEQLREVLETTAPRPQRICTGEFTDSLLLDDLTGLGGRLVALFADNQHAVLELKTKTANVAGLCSLAHGGRTIVSFSVNAPEVVRTEESHAAPLKRRLEAAALMVEQGYRVGFHFDPLILHHGWREGYEHTVAEIFRAVSADKIAWISLGAFRYLPGMKKTVARAHPRSRIMDEEFILAPDGKMRYLRPIRVGMYRHLLEAIRRADPEACVYMCMENPRVWQEVFGYDPGGPGLVRMLDRRV